MGHAHLVDRISRSLSLLNRVMLKFSMNSIPIRSLFKASRADVSAWRRARLLVFARLLQIRAVAGAIEGHFALLAAALRANAPVQGRAKTLFFANFADGATQEKILLSILCHPVRSGRIRLIVGFAFLCVSESPGEFAAGFRQQKRF